ncbi:MAG: MerR family transcriptional regulator [Cyanobacterium sp. T60_A2020_053]|nr:MerR family transcriptional regulator [Cyanobacterium sp. T60_A2020_053]
MDLETIKNNHEEWLIDEFVEVANQLLPQYLPQVKGNSKITEEINVRLVRSYTSQRLMDEPNRRQRYAFYSYRHLLQILLIKRLLTDGIGTNAINDLLTSKTDEELKTLLVGGITVNLTSAHPSLTKSSNSALDFLSDLKNKRNPATTTKQYQPVNQDNNFDKEEEKWTRLKILEGLELHIRDDFNYPQSSKERESLMQHLSQILLKFIQKR